MLPLCYNRPSDFYPRSPCGERRSDIFPVLRFSLFLSTLSLRRATVSLQRWAAHLCDFYPRSPCGERRSSRRTPRTNPDFYPRSPCGERRAVPCGVGAPLKFLSTLSLRRATVFVCVICQRLAISIHALLAESDYRPGPFQLSRTEFLSTLSLRRATRSAPEQLRTVRVFLSTLSLRRATARGRDRAPAAAISIHALLAESDFFQNHIFFNHNLFLSTLSLRRAAFIT